MTELLLFAAGVVAGIMNAIAGGGALITLPAMLSAGMPVLIANATNHAAVLPGQAITAWRMRKYLKKVSKVYLWMVIPCLFGSIAGALILRNIDGEKFAKMVPMLLLFAVIMFATQPWMHKHMHSLIHLKHKRAWNKKRKIFLLTLAILILAVYGGFFGAGFGFIMLAFLSFTHIKHMHEMTALKSLMGLVVLIAAIVCLLGSGLIDWRHAAIISMGNVFGGYAGASVAEKLSSKKIRLIVIAIGSIAVAHLAFREYGTSHVVQSVLQSPLLLSLKP